MEQILICSALRLEHTVVVLCAISHIASFNKIYVFLKILPSLSKC